MNYFLDNILEAQRFIIKVIIIIIIIIISITSVLLQAIWEERRGMNAMYMVLYYMFFLVFFSWLCKRTKPN
jgi:ABC-type multidrug transport system permease subunit